MRSETAEDRCKDCDCRIVVQARRPFGGMDARHRLCGRCRKTRNQRTVKFQIASDITVWLFKHNNGKWSSAIQSPGGWTHNKKRNRNYGLIKQEAMEHAELIAVMLGKRKAFLNGFPIVFDDGRIYA